MNDRIAYDSRAFTIVEMLIAVLMTFILMTAIFSIFFTITRSYTRQNVSAETQQSLRSSLDFIVNDLRTAGLDPIGTAGSGLEEAGSTSIRFTSDRIPDGAGEANGIIDNASVNEERISYYYDPSPPGTLFRRLDAGITGAPTPIALLENVSSLSFTYFDKDNQTWNLGGDTGDIRSVTIAITMSDSAGQSGKVQRTYRTRVSFRNIGL